MKVGYQIVDLVQRLSGARRQAWLHVAAFPLVGTLAGRMLLLSACRGHANLVDAKARHVPAGLCTNVGICFAPGNNNFQNHDKSLDCKIILIRIFGDHILDLCCLQLLVLHSLPAAINHL